MDYVGRFAEVTLLLVQGRLSQRNSSRLTELLLIPLLCFIESFDSNCIVISFYITVGVTARLLVYSQHSG